ncbi:tyrosine-protein phosphatase [Hydrogenophaga sp.]|uniref:tyrosine-protein phosphatase n=1 Tax=Hydrogenophaga sp. TaxID=1904254 RepID=UPI00356567FF
MTTPLRPLQLQSATNFRDLGGLVGAQGRRVRSGRVFRSDHLAALSTADLAHLQTLGLTHSIDFRGLAERAERPYALPGVRTLALSIEPTVVQRIQALLDAGHTPSQSDAVALMCETYRGFVLDNTAVFRRFFQHLLAHPTPLVFHCTAGKDRTGFAAALLLSVLGVEHEAIVHDYLLTNQLYRRSPALEGAGPASVMDVLWQVQPAFLQAAFDCVEQSFGGLPQYLETGLGLQPEELDRLRQHLLEAY